MSERHVFRFFVEVAGAEGARVELDAFDARHARVLHRAHADDPVEIVDRDGAIWHGSFDGPSATIVLGARVGRVSEPTIVLLAFATVGGRFDELVDGAVQAGATRIIPVVRAERDRERIDARNDRLMRIATNAAKQSKRGSVPLVAEAIGVDQLLHEAPGIVVDTRSTELLDEAVRALPAGVPVRLLIGAADGFPAGLVDELVAGGWTPGRLGPTILRAELAGPVAVAIAAMHAAPRPG